MFARVENGVTEIFAENTENAKILDQKKQLSIPIDFFNFFGAAEKLTFLGGG
tara:strand:- start:42 stop:197 length:156 start_codon:yes stop_codon:yes gene_type:complete